MNKSLKKDLAHAALLLSVTYGVVYIVSAVWLFLAMGTVQLLLGQGLINPDTYSIWVWYGLSFDLLVCFLTLLSTIAGIMTAAWMFRTLSIGPLSSRAFWISLAAFIVFLALSGNGNPNAYPALWMMWIAWVLLPAVVFFLAGRQYLRPS